MPIKTHQDLNVFKDCIAWRWTSLDTRGEGYLAEKEANDLNDRFGLLGAMLKRLWKHWKSFQR